MRRKSPAFQSRPLLHFLEHWHEYTAALKSAKDGKGAPKEASSTPRSGSSLLRSGYSPHFHWQLSNQMTWQLSTVTRGEAGLGERQRAEHDGVALRRAIASLEKMDVVGITEDMESFERLLRARWPRVFGRAGCAIPKKNPTAKHAVTGSAPLALDAPTRAAIARMNALDVELYAHAKRLAARRAGSGA